MSIHTFLVRLICLCVLPIIVLAVFLAGMHVRTLQTQRDQEARGQVRNVTMAIDRELSARITALQVLGDSPLLDEPQRLAEFYRAAQGFRQRFTGHIVLADPSSQMLFNTRLPLGAALPKLPVPAGHAAAPEVLATGKPSVGDTFFGPIAGQPLVAVVVPVVRGGETRALLLSIIDTSQ